MCLAIPGEVLEITKDEPSARTGVVSFAGAKRAINLSLVPEARVGEFVLVHVGIAISVIDAHEAQQVFRYLEEIQELELPPEVPS